MPPVAPAPVRDRNRPDPNENARDGEARSLSWGIPLDSGGSGGPGMGAGRRADPPSGPGRPLRANPGVQGPHAFVRESSPGSPGPAAPGPSEANPRGRAKPIPGADRSQSPAPSEANPAPSRRRANPGVQEGRCFVRECPPRGPGPAAPAPNEANPPAPSEAKRRRRPKPISRAERSQSPAPSEPGRPPLVHRGASPCGTGPGCPTSDRPRPDCQRAPDIIVSGRPGVLRIRGGMRNRFPGRPGAGISGLKPTHDPLACGVRLVFPGRARLPAEPGGNPDVGAGSAGASPSRGGPFLVGRRSDSRIARREDQPEI